MLTPVFIEVAVVRIPVSDGWGGPQLACSGAFEALGWVVNTWIHGEFSDLLDQIERGEDADDPMLRGFFAGKPYPEDITEERKAVWQKLTGSDVGDDPVLVGSPMVRQSFLLPRCALVEILHAIARVRAQAAMLPRIPPSVSRAGEQNATPLPPQLFTQTPTNQPPFEEERIALGDVEDAVVALDAMQANVKTEEDRARASAKRRALLDRLEFYGLLDEARVHEKRAFLEGFRLPKLRDYAGAAIALRAYYRSPTRAAYNLGAAPARLLDGHVSLDWFRVPSSIPPGEVPERWLAFAENLLGEHTREGEAGEIFSSIAGRRYEIHWRRDCEQPAVVATRESLR